MARRRRFGLLGISGWQLVRAICRIVPTHLVQSRKATANLSAADEMDFSFTAA
jgi:hypothetical protein